MLSSKFRWITEICWRVGALYWDEESSKSCLLLLPIAKNSVEVLKDKVLTRSAEFFGFFRLCLWTTTFSRERWVHQMNTFSTRCNFVTETGSLRKICAKSYPRQMCAVWESSASQSETAFEEVTGHVLEPDAWRDCKLVRSEPKWQNNFRTARQSARDPGT